MNPLSKSRISIKLKSASLEDVEAYLIYRDWLSEGDRVQSIESAGEGNMNVTLRVRTQNSALVLKQSVPFVARYPEIPAPQDRVIREARFYQMVYPYPHVAGSMPDLLGLDVMERVAAFSDLGPTADLSRIYRQNSARDLQSIVDVAGWLRALHEIPFNEEEQQTLTNRDMRMLNYEHMFDFPLRPNNGLNLNSITPGLRDLALNLIRDRAFCRQIRKLGDIYLEDGPTLLHGDAFPGSFLTTPEGIKAIDPEFAFFGRAEFDVGVMGAHLVLAWPNTVSIEDWLQMYGRLDVLDVSLTRAFAGMEVMRRLIGIAQLPLRRSINEKKSSLDWARKQVLAW